jgi:hypothetical protein
LPRPISLDQAVLEAIPASKFGGCRRSRRRTNARARRRARAFAFRVCGPSSDPSGQQASLGETIGMKPSELELPFAEARLRLDCARARRLNTLDRAPNAVNP